MGFFFQNHEELQLGIAAQQEDRRVCTELFANDDEGRNSFPPVRIKPFLEKCNYR